MIAAGADPACPVCGRSDGTHPVGCVADVRCECGKDATHLWGDEPCADAAPLSPGWERGLQAALDELERTDPAVAEASRRLDEVTRRIIDSPVVEGER